MEVLFQGVVPKYVDRPEDTEDFVSCGSDVGRIIVCDGASESFDAKGWARILVDTVSGSDLTPELLDTCVDRFYELHDVARLSWSKAAAFERGSFSTLLIGQDDPSAKTVSITALGDSVAVLTDGMTILSSFPYESSSQFSERPMLFAANKAQNARVWSSDVGVSSDVWSYADADLYFLCMTDALGEWLMRNVESGNVDAISQLVGMASEQDFVAFVESARDSKSIRRDDTSLVVARLGGV